MIARCTVPKRLVTNKRSSDDRAGLSQGRNRRERGHLVERSGYARAVSSSVGPAREETPAGALLRWAGSKRAILPALIAGLPERYERYVEPFAGSACLFFAAQPRRAVLGDANQQLVGFYRTLRHRPSAVADAVAALPRDPEAYYEIRGLDPAALSATDRAARFLYLNRMAFNGVYRTNRKGRFNVPLGTRVGAFPTAEKIEAAARALRTATLVSADFEVTIAHVGPGDFVYLDPPYSRSPDGNYGVYGYGSFDGRDLERLIEVVLEIDRRGARFLLSYTDTPQLTAALRHFRVEHVAVTTQVGGPRSRRSTREEILVSNA